jgi:hypothetical protein
VCYQLPFCFLFVTDRGFLGIWKLILWGSSSWNKEVGKQRIDKGAISGLQIWTVDNQRHSGYVEPAAAVTVCYRSLHEATGNIWGPNFVASTFKRPQDRPNRAEFRDAKLKLTVSYTVTTTQNVQRCSYCTAIWSTGWNNPPTVCLQHYPTALSEVPALHVVRILLGWARRWGPCIRALSHLLWVFGNWGSGEEWNCPEFRCQETSGVRNRWTLGETKDKKRHTYETN